MVLSRYGDLVKEYEKKIQDGVIGLGDIIVAKSNRKGGKSVR